MSKRVNNRGIASFMLGLSLFLVTLGVGMHTDYVSASSRVKTCYSVVLGKTVTIKGITTKLKVFNSNVKIVKANSKGLTLKGVKEGVSEFNYKGKVYHVITIPNNIPSSSYASVDTSISKNNVFCTLRKEKVGSDAYVTIYNNNDYAVDVTYIHKDIREDNSVFETRSTDIKVLAPHTSYTFAEYAAMPKVKRQLEVTKSYVEAFNTKGLEVSVDSFDSNETCFKFKNTSNLPIQAKLFYLKLDKNGKVTGYGETQDIVVNAEGTSTVVESNYGIKPDKVKIVGYHAYSELLSVD